MLDSWSHIVVGLCSCTVSAGAEEARPADSLCAAIALVAEADSWKAETVCSKCWNNIDSGTCGNLKVFCEDGGIEKEERLKPPAVAKYIMQRAIAGYNLCTVKSGVTAVNLQAAELGCV